MTILGENFIDFLYRQVASKNPLYLERAAGNFLKTKFPECDIWLFNHEGILKIPEREMSFSLSIPDLLSNFPAGWAADKNNVFTAGDKWIISLQRENQAQRALLILSGVEEDQNSKLALLADEIQQTISVILVDRKGAVDAGQGKAANIVSQMAHDMQSLINLATSEIVSGDLLTAKVKYVDRLSREITFYMREIQLVKTAVGADDLVSAVLSEITLPQGMNFNFTPANNFTVTVDVELIDKALSEVIRNAIMASASDGGEIKISITEKKNMTRLLGQHGIEISVQDSGSGIPKDFENLVKDPFFTTWKERGGIGLGLSNADKIIVAHGGVLHVENTDGNGVNVLIYLPMEED